MARSRGANALLAAVFEATYGVNPGSGFIYMPFISASLGGVQALAEDDTLGFGRGQRDHEPDALDVDGDIVVPHDSRYIGYWLKHFLGAPSTASAVAATAVLTFTAQPAASSTFVLNGTVWTFVASGATGNQINIGANLAATVTAIAAALTASVETQTVKNTYVASGGTTITATSKTLGVASNSYTTTVSGTINATWGAATMTGGANKHTFTDTLTALPSQFLELGLPEVPSYSALAGVVLNSWKFSLARKGLSAVTLGTMAQNDTRAVSTVAGTPTAASTYKRFAQKTGEIRMNGTQIASLEAGDIELMNNYDAIEAIRGDGLRDGFDPAVFSAKGSATLRYQDNAMMALAIAGTPVALKYNLARSASEAISYTVHRAFLGRPKVPVDGPGGLKAKFDWTGSRDPALGKGLTVDLTNDIAAY